jgi:hypothetical protein
VYDLFREFLALAPARSSLFDGCAHRPLDTEHVAAYLALQHANVALLPAHSLVKAFEQIGHAHQRHCALGNSTDN